MISINGYKIDLSSPIKTGSQGQIFKCKQQGSEEDLFAEQIIKSEFDNENKNGWRLQASILSNIKKNPQENILKINDVLDYEEKIYLISESYDQTLAEYKKQIQKVNIMEEEILEFMHQIADGYHHLLTLEIVQGDLRDDTIVVKIRKENNLFKIASFKNSIQDQVPFFERHTFKPLFYQAPEQFYSRQQVITQEADIYSLGLILHDFCFPKYIMQKVSSVAQLKDFHNQLKNNQYPLFPNSDRISNKLINYLKNIIVYDPQSRCRWIDIRMPSCIEFISEESLQVKNQSSIHQDCPISGTNAELRGYEIIKLIDKGAQGFVFLAKNSKTQQEVIFKQIPLNDNEISRELEIYKILKQEKHPNIVQFYDQFESNKSLFLVLENCECNLNHYKLQINSDEKIIDFLKQIISGYKFLMSHNILHRDMKLDNIVIKFEGKNKKQPIYKLIDFGIGKELKSELTSTNVGTPLYKAPEVATSSEYNHQCDIYSLGIILYEIVFNQKIPGVRNINEMNQFYEKLKKEKFKCPIYKNWLVTDLIEKMIVYDQNKRINWQNILKHPLFQPIELQYYLFNLYLQGKIVIESLKEKIQNQSLIIFCLLKFCEQTLLLIYKFSANKFVTINNINFYLKNDFQSQIWLMEIQFFIQVEDIGTLLEDYQNYKNVIPDEANFIEIHEEFKKCYDSKKNQVQCIQDSNISNICQQFYDIFENQPLSKIQQENYPKQY